MKNKFENDLEELIRLYGSLEAYNEEQRRCSLTVIEQEARANPLAQRMKIHPAIAVNEVEEVKARPGRRSFWLSFLGLRA